MLKSKIPFIQIKNIHEENNTMYFFLRNVHFQAHTPNTLEWGPTGKSEMGGGTRDGGVGKS